MAVGNIFSLLEGWKKTLSSKFLQLKPQTLQDSVFVITQHRAAKKLWFVNSSMPHKLQNIYTIIFSTNIHEHVVYLLNLHQGECKQQQ